MVEQFEKYAIRLREQKLFEMEKIYQEQFPDFIPLFQRHFNEICENIIKLQQANELNEISYLEYTLLYSNLLIKKETAEVRVYNEKWYFDSRQRSVGHFDFSALFTKYHELSEELMAYRKQSAGKVSAQEVKTFLLSCAGSFYSYIISTFRFSILPCLETEPFLAVCRAKRFEINVGEYMSFTEAVYKENRQRNAEESLLWFSQRQEYDYAFEDFTKLDFSGADLSEIDLRYSDLRYAKLIGTDFQDSMLFGTRFCHANLKDADLRYCMIHEADFTGANLTNAKFTAAEAFAGVPDHIKWKITGYQPVRFCNANLTGADFRRTQIRDADFTGAVMDGAVFSEHQLIYFKLSEKQRQSIRIAGQKTYRNEE
ncbi:pentapeptide repeat-containing protein [bacterium D16-51]|nr:pentapeptide repeat-containing protein [bacterium D16-59]RKI55140.1 pentapeptide repeat-containing protein [bacterium D16-51]